MAGLAFVLGGGDALAKPGGSTPTTVSVKAAGIVQVDDGGNTRIDEDATIIEGIIVLDAKLTDADRLNVKVMADVVTAASMRREHNRRFRALQSEATGTVRIGGTLGYSHSFGDVDLSVRASVAHEYAYFSVGAGAALSVRLLDDNTTLSVNVDGFYDTVAMIRFNGDDEADTPRISMSAGLRWTQILTPEALLTLHAGYTRQDGFLAGQFNSVFVAGIETYEALPQVRDRASVTARFKHAVGDLDAVEVGARGYVDSWDVQALTADLRYFLHFSPEHQLELGYRFHLQGAAAYYASEFGKSAEFMTSDPDLGDFTGHMASLRFRWLTPNTPGRGGDWDVGLSYYFRDNGLHMAWLTLGYTFDFTGL